MVLVLCNLTNHALYLYMIRLHVNISKGFRVTELTQFLLSEFSKGHHSVKNRGGLMLLVFSYCLMMLYICIKFHENI